MLIEATCPYKFTVGTNQSFEPTSTAQWEFGLAHGNTKNHGHNAKGHTISPKTDVQVRYANHWAKPPYHIKVVFWNKVWLIYEPL